jgi:hypothetical protein
MLRQQNPFLDVTSKTLELCTTASQTKLFFVLFCFVVFFGGAGDQIQGFPHDRQVLCHCVTPPTLEAYFYNVCVVSKKAKASI